MHQSSSFEYHLCFSGITLHHTEQSKREERDGDGADLREDEVPGHPKALP